MHDTGRAIENWHKSSELLQTPTKEKGHAPSELLQALTKENGHKSSELLQSPRYLNLISLILIYNSLLMTLPLIPTILHSDDTSITNVLVLTILFLFQ